MLIKTTFDIQDRTPVYAICDPATDRCGMITTNLYSAIKAGQCKSFDEVKVLFSK